MLLVVMYILDTVEATTTADRVIKFSISFHYIGYCGSKRCHFYFYDVFGKRPFLTLRASCGAVYCNRPCLWLGGWMWVFVGLVPR